MATDDAIRAVEIQETEYGEKIVLDSPFDAKEFINALPWATLTDEIEEHGSLREKLEDRGVDDAAIRAAEEFEFSDDFSAHASWDPDAHGKGDGAWVIDVDAWDETSEFFEFCGFDVVTDDNVDL